MRKYGERPMLGAIVRSVKQPLYLVLRPGTAMNNFALTGREAEGVVRRVWGRGMMLSILPRNLRHS